MHVQNIRQVIQVKQDGWTDTVDLGPLFFRLTIDSASEFLFGTSVNSQLAALPGHKPVDRDAHAEFVNAFELGQEHIAKAFRLQEYYKFGLSKQLLQYAKQCHDYIDRHIQNVSHIDKEQNARTDSKKYIFLQELAQQTKDPIEIRDQCLSILLAGRDTTAGLLSFVFLALARDERIFKKLRDTILQDFGTGIEKITFSSLKSCQYLQWVLSEALRLYPSVPFNSRRAIRDTTLPRGGGPLGEDPVFCPKDTEVNYSVYAMHRTPEYQLP